MKLFQVNFPKWQNLSNAVRSFYSISVMLGSYGILLLYSFGIIQTNNWNSKSKLIFLSSILVFFAAKLVVIFCPHEIRTVKSPSEFLEKTSSAFQNTEYRVNFLEGHKDIFGVSITQHSDHDKIAMKFYDHLNKQNKSLRIIISVLLFGGVSLLLLLDLITAIEIVTRFNSL